MSVENLKEYARRCTTDPELRARAKEIGMTDMDEHMRHAESLGLSWNRSDLAAFRKEMVDEKDDLVDLSEQELEDVSGGFITATAAMVVGTAVAVATGEGLEGGDW